MDRRRSSYASVAAGTASPSQGQATARSGAFSHLMNPLPPSYSNQESRTQPQTQPLPHTHPTPDNMADLSSSWGRGAGAPNYWSQNSVAGQFMASGTSGSSSLLIRPSYLRGTKYMEKLESAHKTKNASQRECHTPGQHNSNPGSLSTSSSSVSLQRMAPSHRGMTHEIIEHAPPADDDFLPPLPSKWATVDKHGGLEVSPEGQDIRFASAQTKAPEHDASAARTDYPMPSQCGIYYYEVTIYSKNKEGMIGIGFTGPKASLEKLPGWEPESWGYHGDDGKSFCCQNTGKNYGPTFSANDVVGCGVNFVDGTAFFTKNGVHQGTAFKDLSSDLKLYPSIGMKKPGANITVNFGQAPFKFDIDGMVARERARIRAEINATDLSKSASLTKPDSVFIKELVAQFLRHDGYVETSKAFAREVEAESSALGGSEDLSKILDIPRDADAMHRQQIRSSILDGDIARALKLTNSSYPDVLQKNPLINFRLRCRLFVEMMGKSDQPATKSLPSKGTNGHRSTDDVFEHTMELDDENGADDWDRMDTDGFGADPIDTYPRHIQDPMERAVRYAQELHKEYKDHKDKEIQASLKDIFALFAYEDQRDPRAAQILDPSGRVPVAEELNSAILVSLGKSSSAAIEDLYQQTEVLVSELGQQGGPCTLINVANDILR